MLTRGTVPGTLTPRNFDPGTLTPGILTQRNFNPTEFSPKEFCPKRKVDPTEFRPPEFWPTEYPSQRKFHPTEFWPMKYRSTVRSMKYRLHSHYILKLPISGPSIELRGKLLHQNILSVCGMFDREFWTICPKQIMHAKVSTMHWDRQLQQRTQIFGSF